MRLNPDCIRDILLFCEEHEDAEFETDTVPTGLSDYTPNEIAYHINYCDRDGLLYDVRRYIDGTYLVCDLSPNGHRMIQTIRDQSVFKRFVKWLGEKGLPFAMSSLPAFLEFLD